MQSVLFILACMLLCWTGVVYAASVSALVLYRYAHVHLSVELVSLLVVIILVLMIIKILKWLVE